MGTRCDVVLIHHDPDFSERVARVLRHETVQVEYQLSRYIPDSPVSRFNRLASGEIFSPDDSLWNILVLCRDYFHATFGAFDVAAYPVIRLWKDKEWNFTPDSGRLEAALEISGFDKLVLDPEQKTIHKTVDGVGLDFGAIGKGIALDKMKKILEQFRVNTAFISFGESSVMALGKHPAGEYWPVGIPDPYQPSYMLHTFKARDAFVTTSGTLIRPDRNAARHRLHIVDPRNGMPVSGESLVSVMSGSAVSGEVISTAWLILSDAEKEAITGWRMDTEIFSMDFESQKTKTNINA